jgi:hypothetical protein
MNICVAGDKQRSVDLSVQSYRIKFICFCSGKLNRPIILKPSHWSSAGREYRGSH